MLVLSSCGERTGVENGVGSVELESPLLLLTSSCQRVIRCYGRTNLHVHSISIVLEFVFPCTCEFGAVADVQTFTCSLTYFISIVTNINFNKHVYVWNCNEYTNLHSLINFIFTDLKLVFPCTCQFGGPINKYPMTMV